MPGLLNANGTRFESYLRRYWNIFNRVDCLLVVKEYMDGTMFDATF